MQMMFNVSAIVTGYESVGDHTEFTVQISCNAEVWLISRRFSDFDQLHSRLTRSFGDLVEARLPEKQWFGRFDPNFLAKRQVSLQAYLESVLMMPESLGDPSLQRFLELEKHVDLNGDFQGGVDSNGRPSGNAFGSKSIILNENDRLSAIVENAAQAFIDISEVPEPLEAEQAVQRKNEIVSASQSGLSEQKINEHFTATMTVLQPPQSSSSSAHVSNEEIIAKLKNGSEDGFTYEQEQELLLNTLERVEASLGLEITPPSTDLLAMMDLSLTPATTTSATTSRGSLSNGLDGALDGENGLSSSFH